MLEVLVATVVGGFIALGGVYWSSVLQRRHDEEKEKKRMEMERAHLAGALSAELGVLWDRYMAIVGSMLADAKTYKDFLVEWPVSSGYFTVFDGNTFRLGILDKDDAALVIRTYVTGKGHLDALVAWGKIARKAFFQPPGAVDVTSIQELQAYFPKVKESHRLLKALIAEARSRLNSYR